MYAVIVGCGRVGSLLAATLSSRGHNVVIIDSDEERFKLLGHQFTGATLTGDGTDISILKEAGIGKADALVIATNDDNSNLMSAQIARKMFGVKRVIVRIKDPKKFSVYKEYALEMVSATTLASNKIADILSTPEEIEIIGGIGRERGKIVRFRIPSDSARRSILKLIASGVFYPISISDAEKLSFGIKEEELAPGGVVVGAILADNIKHLGRCCAEEKI